MRVIRGGVGVYVDVAGPDDGRAVVFLHGVTGSGLVWDWLPGSVTRGRKVVKVDLRGHGRSDRAPGAYRLGDFTDDVVAVLRDVVRGPAVLVGHSVGGSVAWSVAQRHPDLVTAAFLVDPPLFPRTRAGGAQPPGRAAAARLRAAADEWQRAGLSLGEIAERLGEAFPCVPPSAAATADAVGTGAFNVKHLDVRVLDAVLDGSMLAAVDTSAPVPAPVLILAADEALGAAFTTADAKTLAASHPAVEVVHLPGAGHRLHQERPNRPVFTRHLVDFLARHA
jgi:pimeloyl-ACP methyl ester carboxylesterase